MSQVRVHNFSISLDGFGTGEGLTFDDPFGHAGHRRHQWYLGTRFWRAMVGEARGTSGVDQAFAERHAPTAASAASRRTRARTSPTTRSE
jgi:hypothetical protein